MIHSAAPSSVPPRVLYRILRLRSEVFVVEQACAYLDLDGRDLEEGALLLWADPDPSAPTVAATARLLPEPVTAVGAGGGWRIGRVATAPVWRHRGLARALVEHALSLCGDAPVVLDAQAHLVGWYEERGFERDGAEFDEDGIPHVPMRRRPQVGSAAVTAGGGAPPRPERSAGAAGGGAAPRVAGKTHVGLERPVNEDAFAVATSVDHGPPRSVAVVCDGIAGGAGGDRAAITAAEAALAALTSAPGEPGESALRRAVAAAHRAVCEAAIERRDGKDEPGTTLVAAVAHGRNVDVAWVGDSRAYLVPRSGPAELLTHDHSWVSHVVDAGELTEEEARASKWAQVITRCIGPAEDPDPYQPPEPSLRSLDAPSPGWLVLCSDGVWGVFAAPEALAAAVRGAPDPDDAAAVTAWVMDRALAAGAADDVTVAVVVL